MTAQIDLLDCLAASLPPRLYLCRINPRRRISRFYVLDRADAVRRLLAGSAAVGGSCASSSRQSTLPWESSPGFAG